MNNDDKNKMEEYLADYLENRLTTSQKQEFEAYLSENPEAKEEFEALKSTWASIQKPAEKEPNAAMDEAFYEMLRQEKTAASKPKIMWLNWGTLKYAAAAAIILAVFWLGRRTSNKDFDDIRELATLKKEVQATKELVMLSMLKQESASERIKAVNFSYEMQKPDNQILTALIKTLNTDPNTNVRAAAAEALSHFGNEKIARDALIQTLLTQKEPTLQITVIDILANLGEKRAVVPIRKLLQETDTEDFVKRKAQESVKMLSM